MNDLSCWDFFIDLFIKANGWGDLTLVFEGSGFKVLLDFLVDEKRIDEYKSLINLSNLLSNISLDDVDSSINFSDKLVLSLINEISVKIDKSLLIVARFLTVLTVYYILYDVLNSWSVLLKKDFSFIELNKLIVKSNSSFKKNLEWLVGGEDKLKNLMLPHCNDEFRWYFMKYSLLVNLIHRFRFFDVIYSDKTLVLSSRNYLYKKEEVPSGWYLVVNSELVVKIGSMLYNNKNIILSKTYLTFKSFNSLEDVFGSKIYSYNPWIINNDIIKDFNKFSYKDLNVKNLIDVLNFLNNKKMKIYFRLFNFIIKLINNNEILKFILKVDTGFSKLNKLSERDAVLNIIKSEFDLLKKFKSDIYFRYVYDNRYRIYVKNIPINYQIERIVRVVVFSSINLLNFYNISNNKDLMIFIRSHRVLFCQKITEDTKIKVNKLITKSSFLKYEINWDLEKCLTLLHRLGKRKNSNIDDRILDGLLMLDFIKDNDVTESALKMSKNPKKIIENIALVHEIKNWIINPSYELKLTWFNDASSNVFQLMVMKLFITDEFTLKVSNIYENDTNFSNIYDYISESLKISNPKYSNIFSKEMIKQRIMPGIYGQTFIRFKEDIKELLEDGNLNNNDKREITKIIFEDSFNVLKDGKYIKEFLSLCKRLAYEYPEDCSWLGKNKMPVFIGKKKEINRNEIRKTIKKEWSILNKKKEKLELVNHDEGEYVKDEILKLDKKINNLNEKLKIDDVNYIRKNVKIPVIGRNLKIRFKKVNTKLDVKTLSNSISASSNHSDDAFILMETILDLKKINIRPLVIHDSIGSNIEFSSIIKIIFKKKNIEFIKRVLKNDEFPFNILKKEFKSIEWETRRKAFIINREERKNKFINNIDTFEKKIMESVDFFN